MNCYTVYIIIISADEDKYMKKLNKLLSEFESVKIY